MRAVIVAVFLTAVLIVASGPVARADSGARESAAVARAKACLAATQGKNLTEAQLKSYISACLASDRPPRELFENAHTIERRCNTIANARQLTAESRVKFMQSCRRKGG
ncbi:MAG: hypothetical protein ACRETB_05030 [Steroidobacteraceae bacterium]